VETTEGPQNHGLDAMTVGIQFNNLDPASELASLAVSHRLKVQLKQQNKYKLAGLIQQQS